jgi:predicted dehydrogenase
VKTSGRLGRRTFLGGVLATSALSYRRVLGANDRIRLGVIGTGMRAQSLMKRLKEIPGNEQVALCDVYEPRLMEGMALLDGRPTRHVDHRKLLESRDVDAVVIGSPQHWHRQMTLDALAAGKDIYLEKAVCHTIEEGRQLVKAVEASKQVVQTGMQQRSWAHFVEGKKMVDAGKLGTINYVHAYWYQNVTKRAYTAWDPAKLDWKRFTGSARAHPVTWDRYYKWRWFWDYGGGPICELLTHWIDCVHWYTGAAAPRTVQASGTSYTSKYEAPDATSAILEYPAFTVAFTNFMGSKIGDGGFELHGSKGTLKVDRAHLAFYSEETANAPGTLLPAPELTIHSQKDGSASHLENFLDCVRSRKATNAPMRAGHEAARASHLANLSLRAGAKMRWNEKTEKVEKS